VDPSIDRDEGVHNARKGFKRIRAALRLVRDEIGEDIYKRENICFWDCSRLLAGARDSFVMVETLDALTDYYTHQLPSRAFAGVHEKLLNRYHTISRQTLYEGDTIEGERIYFDKDLVQFFTPEQFAYGQTCQKDTFIRRNNKSKRGV
jgi:hypothetical protein